MQTVKCAPIAWLWPGASRLLAGGSPNRLSCARRVGRAALPRGQMRMNPKYGLWAGSPACLERSRRVWGIPPSAFFPSPSVASAVPSRFGRCSVGCLFRPAPISILEFPHRDLAPRCRSPMAFPDAAGMQKISNLDKSGYSGHSNNQHSTAMESASYSTLVNVSHATLVGVVVVVLVRVGAP